MRHAVLVTTFCALTLVGATADQVKETLFKRFGYVGQDLAELHPSPFISILTSPPNAFVAVAFCASSAKTLWAPQNGRRGE
jgi:hypothetical protein